MAKSKTVARVNTKTNLENQLAKIARPDTLAPMESALSALMVHSPSCLNRPRVHPACMVTSVSVAAFNSALLASISLARVHPFALTAQLAALAKVAMPLYARLAPTKIAKVHRNVRFVLLEAAAQKAPKKHAQQELFNLALAKLAVLVALAEAIFKQRVKQNVLLARQHSIAVDLAKQRAQAQDTTAMKVRHSAPNVNQATNAMAARVLPALLVRNSRLLANLSALRAQEVVTHPILQLNRAARARLAVAV